MRRSSPRLLAAALFLCSAAPGLAQSADLQVVKSDLQDPIPPGGTQTYTLQILNNGPDDAAFVTLEDDLPAGTTFVSLAEPGGWSCTTPAVGSAGLVSCSIGLLPVGNAAFTLEVQFDAGLTNGTVVTNTATASAETADPDDTNNSGDAATTVNTPTSTDLSLTKTASPNPVLAGGTLTYTLTVTNAGLIDATNVLLTDELSTSTTFQSLSAPGGWTCTTPAVGSTGLVECAVPSLAPGSAVFTLVTQVAAATPPGTVLANNAVVGSQTDDTNPENQFASALVTVGAPPALTATKTVAGPAPPGGAVTYTLVLSNSGDFAQPDNPGDELTDVLPAQLTLVSAAATAGTAAANVATNTVTWNGVVPAHGAVTITIQATVGAGVAPGTTVANQATFAFDADANGSNETGGVSDDPAVGGAADPTSFLVLVPAAIPVLDARGLALLALMLAAAGLAVLGRQR